MEIPQGFVDIATVIPSIQVDLRYATEDNFVGQIISGYSAPKAVLSERACAALALIQKELAAFGLGLKLYDAYRPQCAVDHFVRWAKEHTNNKMKSKYYPNVDKKNLFREGYIAEKSSHSRGSAVDVSIVSLPGGLDNNKAIDNKIEELDMGTPWDFFSPLSWPNSLNVSIAQRANRMLLQQVMTKYGFVPYENEWWHFTLADEQFPDTYFDFSIE